jgi:glycosyltransferase involved in cell wall biosynthesis
MVKISIISTTTYPTPVNTYGGETFIYNLACGLQKLGHEIILYAVKNNNIEYPFKVNQLPNTYGQARWDVEFLSYQYYKNDLLNSDVVLDMSHGKMVAQQLHEFKEKEEVACYMIGNFYARPTLPFNVILNSRNQLESGIRGGTGFEGTFWEKQHSSSGKIPSTSKYAHLGVDTDFYKFNEKKDDYYLWLARFHPTKGPEIAIRLAQETGINLILSGDRLSHPEHYHHWQECMKLIQGWNNIKYIELPQDETHQSAKLQLMQKAKCYLFPVQFHESFGLTTVEALSCGTPVISSNMGALPEIIESGTNGFIANDYEHMKAFINSIDMINPKDCRKSVEKNFSIECMSKRFEKILLELHAGEQW